MTAAKLQELLALLSLNDDASAYKKIFLHYHPRLLSFAYAITHNQQLAEEAVSDVFLAVWKGRSSLLQIANFPLYLYVSTKNRSLTYAARQQREKVLSLDDAKVEFTSLYYDPEQLLITAEMFRSLRRRAKSSAAMPAYF